MNIYNLTFQELEDLVLSLGEKKYRATQIWEFLYRLKVDSFSSMHNIGAKLISFLEENYVISLLVAKEINEDPDGTKKILFELDDQNTIETVLLNNNYGFSLCVSTQVGCNMGCIFCASGQNKKVRDLQTFEMVSQILSFEAIFNIKISSVVVMGIGEPFDNYQNVLNFLNIINHAKGLAIGIRHISISTCGIIPKIKDFMSLNTQVNLAISLHASDDKTRSKLMKINKLYPFSELIDVIKEYVSKTKRRITIEYILIDGVNDTTDDAKRLIEIFKNVNVYINLIPYNEVDGVNLKTSKQENRNHFYDMLKRGGLDITIRKPQGSKIDAACGQLRIKRQKDKR